jgi:hypothetical protein
LMNENNKSFNPSDMFEFIHHPEYGCRDLKGLRVFNITILKPEVSFVICHIQRIGNFCQFVTLFNPCIFTC